MLGDGSSWSEPYHQFPWRYCILLEDFFPVLLQNMAYFLVYFFNSPASVCCAVTHVCNMALFDIVADHNTSCTILTSPLVTTGRRFFFPISTLLTPKIGKSRLGPGRPVRPGHRGGLTGCPVASLTQRGPGGLTAPVGGLTGSPRFRVELGV
jgi:hypothetical protein